LEDRVPGWQQFQPVLRVSLAQAAGKVNAYFEQNKNNFARFSTKQTFIVSIFAAGNSR
jgi:hypothetical protein